MKILKPGKVEQRKFVCAKCGCVFVASPADMDFGFPGRASCPQEGCDWYVLEADSEPYEEPAPTQTDRERLAALIDEALVSRSAPWEMKRLQIADFLIAGGVTFQEE